MPPRLVSGHPHQSHNVIRTIQQESMRRKRVTLHTPRGKKVASLVWTTVYMYHRSTISSQRECIIRCFSCLVYIHAPFQSVSICRTYQQYIYTQILPHVILLSVTLWTDPLQKFNYTNVCTIMTVEYIKVINIPYLIMCRNVNWSYSNSIDFVNVESSQLLL